MRSDAPRELPICIGWLRSERSSPLLPSAPPPRGQKQLEAKLFVVQSPHDPELARRLHKQAYGRSAASISSFANGRWARIAGPDAAGDEAEYRRSSGCPASWDARLRHGRICRRPTCAPMPESPCLPDNARCQAGSRVHKHCLGRTPAVCVHPARPYFPMSTVFRPSCLGVDDPTGGAR
jgi:hypothetical protein